MRNNSSIKAYLLIVTIILLILLLVIPMTIGCSVRTSDIKMLAGNYKFDRYFLPEFYDCYNIDEIPDSEKYINREQSDNDDIQPEIVINPDNAPELLIGPSLDSAWPMYCHDVRHTGRSPYSTAGNPGFERWWFKCGSFVEGSAVIDNDNVIYFGSWDDNFYAVNLSNRSVKWKYKIGGNVQSGPAIDESGVIYVGVAYPWNGLYAFNPNGTKKWRHETGGIYSSPAIGDDGTIYFGTHDSNNPPRGSVNALYPNGTLRWSYKTNNVVYSSPAIGDDGTVYCGSHDTYLYALYPNNGTVKWKYKTGHWVRVSPCIADDGTIYVVSLDNYLHAVYPNGTRKWVTDVGAGTSPTIGQDGTIYAGYRTLLAVDPTDGSVKWTYDVPGNIKGGTPCNSIDGTIYFGTHDHGNFIALNPDGSEKWRQYIGPCEFGPIIDRDGTIYVGSSNDEWVGGGYVSAGYLHAFNELDPNAPSEPEIDGRQDGKVGKEYEYSFKATSPLGRDVYYYVDWGDKCNTGWMGPYKSGEKIELKHSWCDKGVFTIRAKAKDVNDLWGPWSYFEVEIPRNKVAHNSFFLRVLDRLPLLEKLLNLIR